MGFRVAFLTFAITTVWVTVWGFSSSPPDGKTGAPGEGLCTDCHNSFVPNSGDGSLSLLGTPAEYVPDSTYPMIVILSDQGQSRWGFELVVKKVSNQQAGAITITDITNTQFSTSAGITYLKHTSSGAYAGTIDGPVAWTFTWTAPSSGTGRVLFYVAGNAANNNGNNQGDYIYNINKEIAEQTAIGVQPLTPLGLVILVTLVTGSSIWLVITRRRVLRA